MSYDSNDRNEGYEGYEGNELMTSLVSELSELNRKIGTRDVYTGFADDSWQYLFGFRPSGRFSGSFRDEYERYTIFMKAVTETLREFGIHIGNNGYTYIIDAVKVIIDHKSLDIRLNNDVYPYVAMKYDYRNAGAIEHNIRNAIKSACRDNDMKPGVNRMGIFGKNPTNKQFLFYVTEAVCSKMCEETIPLLS